MMKKAFKNIVNVCLPYFSGGWHRVAQARPENKRREAHERGFVVHFASCAHIGMKGALAACLFLSLAGSHSLIVVEHDMAFIARIARRVTVLHEGRVLAEGTLETVQNDPRVVEVYLGR